MRFNADFNDLYPLFHPLPGQERSGGRFHKDGPNFGKPDIGRYSASANS